MTLHVGLLHLLQLTSLERCHHLIDGFAGGEKNPNLGCGQRPVRVGAYVAGDNGIHTQIGHVLPGLNARALHRIQVHLPR